MEKLILLIDDNEQEFYTLREALKENGLPYHCVWACNEERAVHLLHEVLPDLIILDYNMPQRNGIKCLKAIRMLPKMDNVPVMFYSNDNTEVSSEAQANGATCMNRPASIISMIHAVKKIMN